MRSSIFEVAIGSSAEAGSSIRITSGFDREHARDAQALLLAAREVERGAVEPILDLVPQRGAGAATAFADLHELRAVALAVDLRAVDDVLEDRLRERVRAAGRPSRCGAGSSPGRPRARRCSRRRAERTGHARAGREIVHAVERPQERRLSASGRTDQGRDLVRGNRAARRGGSRERRRSRRRDSRRVISSPPASAR